MAKQAHMDAAKHHTEAAGHHINAANKHDMNDHDDAHDTPERHMSRRRRRMANLLTRTRSQQR
jgi:hypothetical protein